MPDIDPVCGMSVEPGSTPYKTLYKGKIYYFCSPQCKKAFQENPEYYLEHGPQGMPGETQGHATHHSHGHSHGHGEGHGRRHRHQHHDLPHGCGC